MIMMFLKQNYAMLIVILVELFVIGSLVYMGLYEKPLNQGTIILAIVAIVFAVLNIRKNVKKSKATIAQ